MIEDKHLVVGQLYSAKVIIQQPEPNNVLLLEVTTRVENIFLSDKPTHVRICVCLTPDGTIECYWPCELTPLKP